MATPAPAPAGVAGLATQLSAVYAADTSADPDHWSTGNPTFGHCAVVACLVQDRCGGVLLRTTVADVSHYFNRIADGTEVDLTRSQFDVWAPAEIVERDRDYVLSFEPTRRRYELLRSRLEAQRATAEPV